MDQPCSPVLLIPGLLDVPLTHLLRTVPEPVFDAGGPIRGIPFYLLIPSLLAMKFRSAYSQSLENVHLKIILHSSYQVYPTILQ
jgi:hypothetical protein